jgi:stage II sporulation protein D
MVLLAIVLVLGVTGCAGRRVSQGPPVLAPAAPIHPGRPLKVAIQLGAAELAIQSPEPITLTVRGVTIGRFRSLGLTPAGRELRIAPAGQEARSLSDTLTLAPAAGLMLELNGKAYRGEIETFVAADGGLVAVNGVDLEDYLVGVVPLEIGSPPTPSYAAVEAQAVAARTYAISHLGRWSTFGFDLYGDERDQVYGGASVETPLAARAVRETQGVVATYGGALIGAYYAAACGGTSAAVEETWAFPPAPYLEARPDRDQGPDFCRNSRHYRWQERWSARDLAATIRTHLSAEVPGAAPTGALEDLAILTRNTSGRVKELRIRMGGQDYVVHGDRIRWVLRRPGGRILRSTSFDLTLERAQGASAGPILTGIVVDGRGNGHGVGMCQAGALEMAAEGRDYPAILGHYYPGIALERLREPRLSQALDR